MKQEYSTFDAARKIGMTREALVGWIARYEQAIPTGYVWYTQSNQGGRGGMQIYLSQEGIDWFAEKMKALGYSRMPSPGSGWMTLKEAAEIVGVTTAAINSWIVSNADLKNEPDCWIRVVGRGNGGKWMISQKGLVTYTTLKGKRRRKAGVSSSAKSNLVEEKRIPAVKEIVSRAMEGEKVTSVPLVVLEKMAGAMDSMAQALHRIEQKLSPQKATLAQLPESLPRNPRADFNEVVRSWAISKNNRDFQDSYSIVYREFQKRYHVDLVARASSCDMKPVEYAESAGAIHNLLNLALELFGEPVAWKNIKK